MRIFRELSDYHTKKDGTAIALGLFDGVHTGHQKVIQTAAGYQETLDVMVLTFTMMANRPDKKQGQKDILIPSERIKRMKKMDLDVIYMPDFEEIRQLSAEDFLHKILHQKLKARVLCCGDDYRFGKRAQGDIHLLKSLCRPLGIQVHIVPPVIYQNEAVSSTRIRKCLQTGEIKDANRMLGYPYSICSEVISGNRIGNTIGFPTINQALQENTCLPKFGVYVSSVRLDGEVYPAVTNVGVKPTIQGNRSPLAETHIIGIEQNLYGRTIRVKLHHFIREEQRFDSLEQLVSRIDEDAQIAKLYYAENFLQKLTNG